jgi:hypothetical protein
MRLRRSRERGVSRGALTVACRLRPLRVYRVDGRAGGPVYAHWDEYYDLYVITESVLNENPHELFRIWRHVKFPSVGAYIRLDLMSAVVVEI